MQNTKNIVGVSEFSYSWLHCGTLCIAYNNYNIFKKKFCCINFYIVLLLYIAYKKLKCQYLNNKSLIVVESTSRESMRA